MKKLLLVIMIAAIILALSACGESAPDPNRTRESCSFLGEAPVYPSYHNNGYCHRDGDGYYWPGFGHHHHK
ncbi:MAG: hypothetical protein J5659_03075 [Clostridia bacterium]|nr:hypothetical protein [Clostridia bacterium]